MKKLIAAAGILTLALVFSPALGATIDGVSDDSTATSLAKYLIHVVMKNNNNAVINNHVTSSANSGGNTITSADDQSGTQLATGSASSATLVSNTANSNLVSEQYEASDGADNEIKNVSDSSAATTISDDTLDNEIENNNDVTVDNQVEAVSDTGNNLISSGDSLQDAHGTTGASDSGTGVLNNFNTNVKEIIRTIRLRIPTL